MYKKKSNTRTESHTYILCVKSNLSYISKLLQQSYVYLSQIYLGVYIRFRTYVNFKAWRVCWNLISASSHQTKVITLGLFNDKMQDREA